MNLAIHGSGRIGDKAVGYGPKKMIKTIGTVVRLIITWANSFTGSISERSELGRCYVRKGNSPTHQCVPHSPKVRRSP